ncbi:MAG: Lsm family RNA-binding protein [Candidatus Marsarchaeota archaeon]
MSFISTHKFASDITGFQDRKVKVVTTTGKQFEGTLKSVDPDRLHVYLEDAKNEKGEAFPVVFLPGTIVEQIIVEEKAVDLKALAEILEKTFPRMVKVDEGGSLIIVADRVRVTTRGVSGVGPTAEKVKKIYEDFLRSQSQ